MRTSLPALCHAPQPVEQLDNTRNSTDTWRALMGVTPGADVQHKKGCTKVRNNTVLPISIVSYTHHTLFPADMQTCCARQWALLGQRADMQEENRHPRCVSVAHPSSLRH